MSGASSKNSHDVRLLAERGCPADLPLEELTCVCLQLDLRDLIRVAETCTRFRHGDSGLKTVELPTKSPVVAALREQPSLAAGGSRARGPLAALSRGWPT
jgi:hypothetical protein